MCDLESSRDPNDLSAVLLALTRRLDEDLRSQTGWRCARVIPRIDGSAYLDLEKAGFAARIDWCAPGAWPSAEWSSGELELGRHANSLGARLAEQLLATVRKATTDWLAADWTAWLRFWPPSRARVERLSDTLRQRLPVGRTRWGAWLLERSEPTPNGAFSLVFQGPKGPVGLLVGPPGQALPKGAERILTQAGFCLALTDDCRTRRERGILANQVERVVGFVLSRALPVKNESIQLVADRRADGRDSAEPDPADREADQEGDEFYLYLSKCVCNASCIFCSRARPERKRQIEREAQGFDFDAELASIARTLARRKQRGTFRVGGHEPTIYPTFMAILEAAVREGYDPVCVDSNGLALSDPGLVDALERTGVTEVRLPVYGMSDEVNDAITGVTGSLQMVKAALANLAATRIRVQVKTVVMKQNLEELVELIAANPKLGMSFIMPITEDPDDYAQVCPRLTDIPPAVMEQLGELNIPCQFPTMSKGAAKPVDTGYVVLDDGRVAHQGYEHRLSREQRLQIKAKLTRCSGCRHEDRCSGIYPMYYRVYGTEGFEPS